MMCCAEQLRLLRHEVEAAHTGRRTEQALGSVVLDMVSHDSRLVSLRLLVDCRREVLLLKLLVNFLDESGRGPI